MGKFQKPHRKMLRRHKFTQNGATSAKASPASRRRLLLQSLLFYNLLQASPASRRRLNFFFRGATSRRRLNFQATPELLRGATSRRRLNFLLQASPASRRRLNFSATSSTTLEFIFSGRHAPSRALYAQVGLGAACLQAAPTTTCLILLTTIIHFYYY